MSRDDERSTGAVLSKLFRDVHASRRTARKLKLSSHFPIKQYFIWKELGVTHPVRFFSFLLLELAVGE